MKHLFKGLLLFLSLIFLASCATSIEEGTIINKHMAEEHKETDVYMIGDMPIFSDNTRPAEYYFDVYGEDENGHGHTVTTQVNENAYNHHKIGDFWRISI